MHEETDPGFLTGHPAGEGSPRHNPVDAVQAVAQPREEAEAGAYRRTESSTGGDGISDDAADGYGEFAWPDGYVADPGAVAKFVPLARKLGLPREGAQELANLYAELDIERNHAQAGFIAKNNAEWLREIQSHPEFGGANLERTGSDVASMIRRYGSPLLTAQIRQMNIQNWPEMFYFLARVSQAVNEDCSPSGSAGDAAAGRSAAQILFPGLK